MLDRTGEAIPPCGAPLSVACHRQSSRYPAESMLDTNRRNRPSWIFSASTDLMIEWPKDPKQSVMSPSMNHTVPCHW